MIELDVIERDSSAAAFQNIVVDDSVTIHVSFDKPLDPAIPLQPALVRLQRADSSQLVVTKVQWAAAFDQARQAQLTDSARRADSTKARQAPAAAAAKAQVTAAGARDRRHAVARESLDSGRDLSHHGAGSAEPRGQLGGDQTYLQRSEARAETRAEGHDAQNGGGFGASTAGGFGASAATAMIAS
jgi:hypothetical protein